MLAAYSSRTFSRVILAMTLLLTLPGLPVRAAPPTQKDGEITPIQIGQMVFGQITMQYYEALYSFTGRAGDVVTITMQTTNHTLDPYLALYAMPDSVAPLAEDDDSGGGVNAQIVYTLNYTGSYIIAATRFGGAAGDTAGDYTLTITTGGAAAPTAASQTVINSPRPTCNGIPYDVVNTITLNDLNPAPNYWITAIGLGAMSPVLAVTGPNGQPRCSTSTNDNTGMAITIPQVGTFAAGAANTARLKLSGAETAHTLTIQLGAQAGTGGLYALAVEGLAITPFGDTDAITVTTAPAGEFLDLGVYVITPLASPLAPTPQNPALSSPGPTPVPRLDPVLTLINTGQVCDDIGGGTCPGVTDYTISTTLNSAQPYIGQPDAAGIRQDSTGSPLYYQISGARAESSGPYALIINGQAQQSSAPADASGTTLLPQDAENLTATTPYTPTTYTSVLGWNEPLEEFLLSGESGDRVEFELIPAEGSQLAPHMMLISGEGDLLAETHNNAFGGSASMTVILPETGSYTIRVVRAVSQLVNLDAPYTLHIRHYQATYRGVLNAAPDTLEYGEERTGQITNEGWYHDYTFTGAAQDVIQATLVHPGGTTLDPYLRLYDSAGNILQDDDNTLDGRNASLRFTLPTAGTYTLRATRAGFEFGSTQGAYRLTLLRETLSPPAQGIPSLDWALPSRNGETTLAAGFSPDPFTVSLTAGGSINAAVALNNNCEGIPRGFVNSAPDFRLHYTSGRYRLRFFVRAAADTTLIVSTPDAAWYCADDTAGASGFNPMLEFLAPSSGQYDIWVGSYGLSLGVEAQLFITETDAVP